MWADAIGLPNQSEQSTAMKDPTPFALPRLVTHMQYYQLEAVDAESIIRSRRAHREGERRNRRSLVACRNRAGAEPANAACLQQPSGNLATTESGGNRQEGGGSYRTAAKDPCIHSERARKPPSFKREMNCPSLFGVGVEWYSCY